MPPTLPATRFLTGGRTRLIGTSLGNPGAGQLPNTAMFWPAGVTVGWPSGDLACYNRWKDMTGRAPDTVRLYVTNPFTATGVTGSAGNYGFFTSDWRSIANDGAFLIISFKDNVRSGSGGWPTIAADLNAAGSNSTKTDYLTLIQNLKRWHDDTGNTAAIKSILLTFHHEPSNDGGTGANYVAAAQAIFNFFLDNGIGYGPKPSTGHGSAWVGTWYDMIEWCHVGISADMGAGGGTSYAYYPGDGFNQWVYADMFNWSGGYPDSGGTGFTVTKGGGVAQPGDTGPFGHYTDSLKTLRTVAQNFLNWYKAGSGGFRNVRLGLGEWAISEDLDRFTVSGSALANPKVHSADKHIKGDWYTGALKWFRGESFTVPGGHDTGNNVPADPDGLLIINPVLWQSQAAQPRWWNSRPFLTGDTTGPTTTGGTSTGTDASYSYDKVLALLNDSIFSGSPVIHTPPSGDFLVSPTEGGDAGDWTFDATTVAGDGAIVSYAWDPGDSSGIVTHTTAALTDELAHSYATSGLFNVTLTVTDANALTYVATHQVIVVPANTQYAGAPLLAPGQRVKALRVPINNAVTALETYTRSRVHRIGMKAGTWTNMPSARTEFLGGTTARRYADLTGMTIIKTSCFLSTAGATGAKLAPAYSIDGGSTWKWFNGTDLADTAGDTVSTTLLGATTNADTAAPHVGSYAIIPTEARVADVLVTMHGISGDGAADPVYESIDIQVM